MTSIKKANDVVKLQALIDGKKVVVIEDVIRQDLRLDDADGVECFLNEKIFTEFALQKGLRGTNLVIEWRLLSSALLQIENLISLMEDLTSHNTKYTSPTLTQKVFANMRMVGKGFSEVETPLFASMLVQPWATEEDEEDEVKVPTTPTSPSPTPAPSPPPQDPIPTPPQAQPVTPHALPTQEQPTTTSKYDMSDPIKKIEERLNYNYPTPRFLTTVCRLVLFIHPGCRFVVGVSEEDDGSGVTGSGVEQEVGKRGIRVWRENRLVNSVFLALVTETALDFSRLRHASRF
nr:hypothetical protein [Tanacetum cinerariifolium]